MKCSTSWARWYVFGGAILAFTVSSNAVAQGGMGPFSVGISAGASVPTGDLGDELKTGFNIGAQVGVKPVGLPIGFRLDAQFNRFEPKGDTGGADVNFDITAVSLDVVLMPSGMTSPLKPYFLAGPSYFHNSASAGGVSVSDNKWGLNAGAGVELRLTGFSTFLEARYDWINVEDGNASFVPISVGIKFP
jgi:opacity protein-like surface antigen